MAVGYINYYLRKWLSEIVQAKRKRGSTAW